jgi:hypothetical protein
MAIKQELQKPIQVESIPGDEASLKELEAAAVGGINELLTNLDALAALLANVGAQGELSNPIAA